MRSPRSSWVGLAAEREVLTAGFSGLDGGLNGRHKNPASTTEEPILVAVCGIIEGGLTRTFTVTHPHTILSTTNTPRKAGVKMADSML